MENNELLRRQNTVSLQRVLPSIVHFSGQASVGRTCRPGQQAKNLVSTIERPVLKRMAGGLDGAGVVQPIEDGTMQAV